MKPLSGVGGQPIEMRAAIEPPVEKVSRVEAQRPTPTSRIHFNVHAAMPELQAYAREKGWVQRGFGHLSIPWQELRFTTDGWKTTQTLKSTDVPSPIVNGFFNLPNVPKGTTVEFAIHVGVASHAPGDIAGYRERGELWLNNGGRNFTQVSQ